jgi:hypothetical protein
MIFSDLPSPAEARFAKAENRYFPRTGFDADRLQVMSRIAP